ncbi:hypothetical protein [Candidatus Magnetobacterium casense]|uniref:hypothetical protein n=1 Tax=Candidatus Magnetobacterium casense TaxID=1455061 RepID=UPI00058F7A90|nr:hypothetical protein [Candidatus Magnetobacterium casensis]
MGKPITKYLKTFSNAIKTQIGIIIRKYRHSFIKGMSAFECTTVLEMLHMSSVKDIVISLLLVRLKSTGLTVITMKNINRAIFI